MSVSDVAPAPPVRRGLCAALRGSRPLREFRRSRAAMISAAFLLFLVTVAVLAPALAHHDPTAQTLSDQLQGPSGKYWLGTDTFGRDVYSRLVYSTRVTLLAVVQAVALSAVIGVPLGLAAGYFGEIFDAVLSRVFDALLSLPPLILAIAIVGILGPGLTNVMIAIGIVLAPSQYRLARGSAQSVSTETHIEASRAIGCSSWRVLWRHVLPNASSPLLVQASFSAGIVVIAEASLSFLGLGVQSPQSSWGTMLRDAFDNIYDSPWFLIAPTVMIVATILAFSTFGDGLRDALEGRGVVRMRNQLGKATRRAKNTSIVSARSAPTADGHPAMPAPTPKGKV